MILHTNHARRREKAAVGRGQALQFFLPLLRPLWAALWAAPAEPDWLDRPEL